MLLTMKNILKVAGWRLGKPFIPSTLPDRKIFSNTREKTLLAIHIHSNQGNKSLTAAGAHSHSLPLAQTS
ncbi:hypothetical protein [Paenibacillus eucommiae]|uniref:Uncharacterized protein n=1 Tax=Paenibacillus eucommiae TaxID=1355755 RepID=A0ABS4J178_9BACL|nr:hypothetical protein [Paenibacillus eucommiae]MBP1993588.1 hypothetical protein [Paenibacillus eucommiae]